MVHTTHKTWYHADNRCICKHAISIWKAKTKWIRIHHISSLFTQSIPYKTTKTSFLYLIYGRFVSDSLYITVCNIMLLTGCFCIGPGIDSRLAVLAPRPVGPILITSNLYQGQYRNSQFVTRLLNNLTGRYDRAVWIFFQGRMDKFTGPYGYIDRAVWAWF